MRDQTESDLMTEFEPGNPLDSVEDILANQNWSFSRMAADELMVDITGHLGNYRMIFNWQEEACAMQFTCFIDKMIPAERTDLVALSLARINAMLWLGHFDLPTDTLMPCFRHTTLFRGQMSSGIDHLQELMDIALNECERFFPAFDTLARIEDITEDVLSLAISDVAGEG